MVKRFCQRLGQKIRTFPHPLSVAAGGATLVFITDADRVPDPFGVLERLPAGSIVICRDYEHEDRFGFASELRTATRARRQRLLVAGDVELARKIAADGVHLPEYQLFATRRRPPVGFISAACHSRRALLRAKALGLDLALVSPVFPTRSHPDHAPLGLYRFARRAASVAIDVAALGGVTMRTAKRLAPLRLAAVAAIDGFME